MDKATVESVMALAFELARIREQHGAQSGMYLSEVRALRAEAERLAAQAAPTEPGGDVEPFVFEEYPYHYEAMGCGLEDRNITDRYEAMAYGWERAMERAAEAIPDDLYPAPTVAALKARVAELEKDEARLEFVCNSPNRMVERESGLWRVYEDVAPTDHPTAVWQGITPRWHVTPREAIDAAITAALTKGQP